MGGDGTKGPLSGGGLAVYGAKLGVRGKSGVGSAGPRPARGGWERVVAPQPPRPEPLSLPASRPHVWEWAMEKGSARPSGWAMEMGWGWANDSVRAKASVQGKGSPKGWAR